MHGKTKPSGKPGFLGIAFMILTLPAWAPAAESPAGINPALLYYQAILLIPKLHGDDFTFAFDSRSSVDKRFGKLISRYDAAFKLLRQAAHSKVPCDWGLDLSEGLQTPMPRLSPAKHLVEAARSRVRWALNDGRESEARDDLLAALALGRNLARDGLPISASVQFSIEALVARSVAESFYQFSPETLGQIVAGIDAAPARGTIAQSMPAARYLGYAWYLMKVQEFQRQNPASEAKTLDFIRELFRSDSVSEEHEKETDLADRLLSKAGGTVDGVVRLIRELEPLYERLANVMALPYSQCISQIEALKLDVSKQSNPLAPPLLGYERMRQNSHRMEVQFAMIHAAVQYKLHGEEGLRKVMDPCGTGPFAVRRFIFEGVDRGFELKADCHSSGFDEALVFVEKSGTPISSKGERFP